MGGGGVLVCGHWGLVPVGLEEVLHLEGHVQVREEVRVLHGVSQRVGRLDAHLHKRRYTPPDA